jgi:hypothetical protein
MICNLKIGNIVRILPHGLGYTYTTYYKMAQKLKVENWEDKTIPNSDVDYVVKGFAEHEDPKHEDIIVWIEDKKEKGFLIGHEALMVIQETLFLSKEDFNI